MPQSSWMFFLKWAAILLLLGLAIAFVIQGQNTSEVPVEVETTRAAANEDGMNTKKRIQWRQEREELTLGFDELIKTDPRAAVIVIGRWRLFVKKDKILNDYMERALVAQVAEMPVSDTAARRNAYEQLVKIRPENVDYQQALDHLPVN